MRTELSIPVEKLAFAAGLALLVASAIIHGRLAPRAMIPLEASGPVASQEFARAVRQTAVPAARVSWSPPPGALENGAGYELFTPPTLFFDPVSGEFAFRPPAAAAPSLSGSPVELLAVERVPFRLQLVGFVGDEGGWAASFTSAETGGTILARPGHRFPELGLRLLSVEAGTVETAAPLGRGGEFAAWAVLRDERSGQEVRLDSRRRKYTDTLRAMLLVAQGGATAIAAAAEGETILAGDARFRVEQISLDPEEVVLVPLAPGSRGPVVVRPGEPPADPGSRLAVHARPDASETVD